VRIRVDKIPAAGARRTFGADDAWALEAAALALEGRPTSLEGEITVAVPDKRRAVDVRVVARTGVDRPCDRCGESVRKGVVTEETLRYLPAGSTDHGPSADEEIELAEDDLDLGWYEDGSLVLADVLTEALALAVPSRTVCEDEAGCDARTAALLEAAKPALVGHPAFAALQNLKN
jgi:uncharacterized metal-binding protein YceD (DUF177 family)